MCDMFAILTKDAKCNTWENLLTPSNHLEKIAGVGQFVSISKFYTSKMQTNVKFMYLK